MRYYLPQVDVTHRRTQILVAIIQYRREHGYAPTFRDIAERVDVGVTSVFAHLKVLRRQGLVDWSSHHKGGRTLHALVDVATRVPAGTAAPTAAPRTRP